MSCDAPARSPNESCRGSARTAGSAAVRSLVCKVRRSAIHPHRTASCEYKVANFCHGLVLAALAIAAISPRRAVADEGGVSFWLPGQYGSFAAVAPTPGWSLPLVFYNYGGAVSAGRVLPRGHLLSSGLNDVVRRTVHRAYLHAGHDHPGRAAELLARVRARLHLHVGAHRPWPVVGVAVGFAVRRQRSLSDGAALLEFRRSQRHGLPCRRHSGRQLRSRPVVKHRHRPRRDRRRRRLYLPQRQDRHRGVGDPGVHQETLKIRQPTTRTGSTRISILASLSSSRRTFSSALWILLPAVDADHGQLAILGPTSCERAASARRSAITSPLGACRYSPACAATRSSVHTAGFRDTRFTQRSAYRCRTCSSGTRRRSDFEHGHDTGCYDLSRYCTLRTPRGLRHWCW